MRVALVVTLISSIAFADPPADAPVRVHACGEREVDLDASGCAVLLKQGEAAPFSGVLLDEQEDVRRTRDRAGKTVTLDHAEQDNVLIPKGKLAALITGIIVLSAAAAAAVTYAATRK